MALSDFGPLDVGSDCPHAAGNRRSSSASGAIKSLASSGVLDSADLLLFRAAQQRGCCLVGVDDGDHLQARGIGRQMVTRVDELGWVLGTISAPGWSRLREA